MFLQSLSVFTSPGNTSGSSAADCGLLLPCIVAEEHLAGLSRGGNARPVYGLRSGQGALLSGVGLFIPEDIGTSAPGSAPHNGESVLCCGTAKNGGNESHAAVRG